MRHWRAEREYIRQLAMAALYEKIRRDYPGREIAQVLSDMVIEMEKLTLELTAAKCLIGE